MKRNSFAILFASIVMSIFMVLSFSCASDEPAVPMKSVSIRDVSEWIDGHEVDKMVNNGLTAEQLMEVIKLCISTGELKGVSITEENAVLSYAVLKADTQLKGNGGELVALQFTFSCSISKNGTLRLRITGVSEKDVTKQPFNRSVRETDFASYKENVINAFDSKLQNFAGIIVTRSADFA